MYESSSERWSPVQSVEKILLSVLSMLAEPNDESGANIEACVRILHRTGLDRSDLLLLLYVRLSILTYVSGVFVLISWLQKVWRSDRKHFDEIVRSTVRKTLGL